MSHEYSEATIIYISDPYISYQKPSRAAFSTWQKWNHDDSSISGKWEKNPFEPKSFYAGGQLPADHLDYCEE